MSKGVCGWPWKGSRKMSYWSPGMLVPVVLGLCHHTGIFKNSVAVTDCYIEGRRYFPRWFRGPIRAKHSTVTYAHTLIGAYLL